MEWPTSIINTITQSETPTCHLAPWPSFLCYFPNPLSGSMQHLLPKFQIQIVHLICVNHHVFVFNGNGDGRNGVSDRSIGSGIPIPYMFCCQYSCQLLSPLRPRRFHRKTPVRGINRCRSLLPILRIILQYALPGVNNHQLRVYGLLSETMRFDYVLVSNGLPHWMVRTWFTLYIIWSLLLLV